MLCHSFSNLVFCDLYKLDVALMLAFIIKLISYDLNEAIVYLEICNYFISEQREITNVDTLIVIESNKCKVSLVKYIF